MATESQIVFAIPRFPERLRDRYKGSCHRKGITVRAHLEYLIAKFLREEREKEGREE